MRQTATATNATNYAVPGITFSAPVLAADGRSVTLTVTLNGKLLDRTRFEQPGPLHYSHDVPQALLRKNAVNLVAIDPHPVWVSKADGGRLGFILSRAGFTD